MLIFLAEHGDREVAASSMMNLAGMPMDSYYPQCSNCRNWHGEHNCIIREVEDPVYQLINYKGSAYFGIGMALARIVEIIFKHRNSVLTISTYLDGNYDLHDIYPE